MLSNRIRAHYSLFVCLIFIFHYSRAVIIGSNTAVSKQARIFFPAADNDNSIVGFTVINDGITFENSSTTGLYDGFFHIAGDVVFNQGKLTLNQNIEFKSPLQFGTGYIDAQLFAILFPDNVSIFSLPNDSHKNLLSICDQKSIVTAGTSVKWSYDSHYVAVTTQSGTSSPELLIYKEQDCVLTLDTTSDIFSNNNVNSVSWRPGTYQLAIGRAGGLLADKVQILSFDSVAHTITSLSGVSLLGGGVSVAWRPDGNFLAVAEQNSSTIRVYPVNISGVLGTPITAVLPNTALMINNTIAWHESGNYFAIGSSVVNLLGAEFFIYKFNGTTLTLSASQDIGGSVRSVAWKPGTNIVSVGHAATGERILNYQYNDVANTLTLKTTMATGLQTEVLALNWDLNGTYLAVGTVSNASNFEFQLYGFEPVDERLNLVAGYSLNANVPGVAFKPSDNLKIMAVDAAFKATLFNFIFPENTYGFIFENAKIFFKSDVVFNAPILFKGKCILNGGNNTLDMSSTGSIIVDSGASLKMEDIKVINVAQNNIQLLSDSSILQVRQTEFSLSDYVHFDRGRIDIIGDTKYGGGNIFAYKANSPFSIASGAQCFFDSQTTFSLAPSQSTQTMITFEDESSQLYLNNATFLTTTTGTELLRGMLIIEGNSMIEAVSHNITSFNQGITLGDGQNEANDFKVEILQGSILYYASGALNIKNVNPLAMQFFTPLSMLRMVTGTSLRIFKNLNIGDGRVIFEADTILARIMGQTIIGSTQVLGNVTYVTIPS